MLFQNIHELSKEIEKLIDTAVQFEITARDQEIKQLKDKLYNLSRAEKELEKEKMLSAHLSRENTNLRMLLDKICSPDFASIKDTSWDDGNEYGECW